MCRRRWGILWAYSCRSIPCSDHRGVFSHGFRMSEATAAASLGVIGSNVSLPEKSCLPSRRKSWWTPMFRGWVSEQHRASTEKLKCHWKSWEGPEKVKIEEVKRMKKTWKRPKLAKKFRCSRSQILPQRSPLLYRNDRNRTWFSWALFCTDTDALDESFNQLLMFWLLWLFHVIFLCVFCFFFLFHFKSLEVGDLRSRSVWGFWVVQARHVRSRSRGERCPLGI